MSIEPYYDPLGVKAVLDQFYDKDGHEPDWSALLSRLFLLKAPLQTFLAVLKVIYAVYEETDTEAQRRLVGDLLDRSGAGA